MWVGPFVESNQPRSTTSKPSRLDWPNVANQRTRDAYVVTLTLILCCGKRVALGLARYPCSTVRLVTCTLSAWFTRSPTTPSVANWDRGTLVTN